MTLLLVDTCIIIDHLRGYPEATPFLEAQVERSSISVISTAELFEGIREQSEEAAIVAVLRRFNSYDVTPPIARQAGRWRQQFRRSHGVSMPDALIAATAEMHGLRLVTRNVRHFPMLDDVLVPYR